MLALPPKDSLRPQQNLPIRPVAELREVTGLITILNNLPKNLDGASIALKYKAVSKSKPSKPSFKARMMRLTTDPLLVQLSMAKNLAYAIASQRVEKDGKAFERLPNKGFDGLALNSGQDFMKIKSGKTSFMSGCSFASAECRGDRGYMEDKTLLPKRPIQITFPSFGQAKEALIFGLFDGHGGENCSNYYSQHFVDNFLAEITYFSMLYEDTDTIIYNALKMALIRMDENVSGGSTANCVLLFDDVVYVANLGDCRAIYIPADPKQEAIALTDDAKPEKARFAKKVIARGGTIDPEGGIENCLRVAGAVGDQVVCNKDKEKVVSNRAQVTKMKIDGTIIMACDGIWDVASTKQVGKAFRDIDGHGSLQIWAQEFIKKVWLAGSEDNMSVIAISKIKTAEFI